MPTIEWEYQPRALQWDMHEDRNRFRVNICHRRFGKTVWSVNDLLWTALECDKVRPRVAYVAPQLNQAKDLAWDYAKHYARAVPGAEFNEAETRVDLPNGGRLRLYGADKPDTLRGRYFDKIVLDEYAQMNPSMLEEIVMPALVDRQGTVVVMGTPKGRNHLYDQFRVAEEDDLWSVHLYKASETGIIPEHELAMIRRMMRARHGSDDMYEQEFECSFTAAVQGAYYANELQIAREEGRISDVPIESGLAVHTCWDLGHNDTTAIWFFQLAGLDYRFVDYYEASGEALSHYARVLQERGYLYGDHYLPHDATVTDLSSLDHQTREEVLNGLGVKNTVVVPRVRNILDGIEQVRLKLGRCWFDKERCDAGIRTLENYQKAFDENRQTFRERPLHNWASNGADAFRQFAQGLKDPAVDPTVLSPERAYSRAHRRGRERENLEWVV